MTSKHRLLSHRDTTLRAIVEMIHDHTASQRTAYAMARDEYRAASEAFVQIPSASHYVALQRAALALQDARSALDEAKNAARREAGARWGEDAALEAAATLTRR